MWMPCIRINRIKLWIAGILVVSGIVCAVVAVGRASPVQTHAETDDGLHLPVIMYHHLLKDPALQGKYVIDPQELEDDLKQLQSLGYTTVLPTEIAAWESGGGALPEKPVLLSFDDGYLSVKEYALPLLQKYGAKAVVCCVGSYTDAFTQTPDCNLSYAHMSWDDLKALSDDPLIEIGSHSYDMHQTGIRKGIQRMENESEAAYRTALYDDVFYLQQLFVRHGIPAPVCFAYPFGAISSESPEILEGMGFTVLLSCTEQPNILKSQSGSITLNRYNRPHGFSLSKALG